ncbi:multidrug efflux SMR transporter [Modestobacter sp. VKM Ac-2983]|uniref:DMT family transporter n=1 Tax=Modestobacter sp. VKM Ac-2983 TaxID=3004137 RepID=UPI0022AB509A|nr:multidrug efflux SMR transporter [Modestobacter sp. VKM Ac-2983]MCZ2804572.1 multidrug efflux SMR transporter [Modestobacter sp. VKM Ac-2983]
MTWAFLAAAIACEVGATMSLRASDGLRDRRWAPLIVLGYLACFTFLTLALREGLAIGVAYGIWAASGVALTAVIAHLLFRDPLTRTMGAGIVLIAVGVLLVELGAH